MRVTELYDGVSTRYDEIVKATRYLGPKYLSNALSSKFKFGAELILDLGCANGSLGCILRQSYPLSSIHGYDISPKMIKLAELSKVYDSVTVQDLNKPLESISASTVSLAVGFGFCEFLDHPENLILNLYSLLIPGGVVILSFQEYWPHNPELAPRSTHSGSVTHNAYSISEIAKMFNKTGLIVNKIESTIGYVSRSGFKCPYVFVTATK